MSWTRRHFLLAGLDEGMSLTLRDTLQRYAVVRTERSFTAALALLGAHDHWAGVVVDLDHGPQDPCVLLERLASTDASFRILALAEEPDPEVTELCRHLGGDILRKPVPARGLGTYVCRALVHSALPSTALTAAVEGFVARHGLTPRELQLVVHALADEGREDVARRLGITPNTLKSQVRGLLRKCGARSMERMASELMRAALCENSVSRRASGPVLLSTAPRPVDAVSGELEGADAQWGRALTG